VPAPPAVHDPMMAGVDSQRPSTWKAFRPGLCEGCWAGCCTLPLEVTIEDLLRLGLASPDETEKKTARRLMREGVVRSYRAGTGLFTLEQRPSGDCRFLDSDRRCTVYDKRPNVCRRFPSIGPRPGFCPARQRGAADGE
jgi:Fe-S-cluster containining protein